ncbi:hypothetical protein S7711_09843 [Stachybotrys chartarum IBT 7711]|uniref:FAD-binding PCMH-type domain-containing protein n=1 Tax=Stachybotrys chartarum (strain CBS 109288 / IBT 7711) TaxID=1280523 RepID=A0A084BB65_STACB|nr:hypothetical protein S7711_09843 [Stachybotrys chartarum IBT 7711]
MRTMEFAQKNTIAKLGPGLRWLDVYEWTNSHGLGVLGGRFAPVGVSGILLGGGVSYFGSRFGWAVNNVAKYEVVLANSTIVNASAKENPDLFWALKGGSSNYGIVTRFDIKTFPLGQVFSEQLTFSSEHLDEFLEAASVDDALVYRFSKRFIAALEKKSKAEGNKYPFVYLNDADTSRDSFPLYGKGKSFKKTKAIRDRYDPKHIFNDLLPGGFKLTT